MVYLHTHVDADQDILAPAVRTGITAPLIHAEMVAHARVVYLHTHVDADQDILAPAVRTGITAPLIPAETVAHV